MVQQACQEQECSVRMLPQWVPCLPKPWGSREWHQSVDRGFPLKGYFFSPRLDPVKLVVLLPGFSMSIAGE